MKFEIIYFLLNPSGLTQSQACYYYSGGILLKNARKMPYDSVVMALLSLQALKSASYEIHFCTFFKGVAGGGGPKIVFEENPE